MLLFIPVYHWWCFKVTQNLNEVTKDLGIARIDLKEATRIKDELMEAKRMVGIS